MDGRDVPSASAAALMLHSTDSSTARSRSFAGFSRELARDDDGTLDDGTLDGDGTPDDDGTLDAGGAAASTAAGSGGNDGGSRPRSPGDDGE
jgi:hypothetical protein